jgi:hypothetical protein
MKIARTLKKGLPLLGAATFAVAAVAAVAAVPAHADTAYGYYGTPGPNPWVAYPAYPQARAYAVLKQRQAQLDQRQDTQMERILNGMGSGRLTLREAAGLLREHVATANLERQFMFDGRLGPHELAMLELRLNEAARHITFEQQDRDRAHAPGYPGGYDRR